MIDHSLLVSRQSPTCSTQIITSGGLRSSSKWDDPLIQSLRQEGIRPKNNFSLPCGLQYDLKIRRALRPLRPLPAYDCNSENPDFVPLIVKAGEAIVKFR